MLATSDRFIFCVKLCVLAVHTRYSLQGRAAGRIHFKGNHHDFHKTDNDDDDGNKERMTAPHVPIVRN